MKKSILSLFIVFVVSVVFNIYHQTNEAWSENFEQADEDDKKEDDIPVVPGREQNIF